MLNKIAVMMLLVLCTSCMVGPDYQSPDAVKDEIVQQQTSSDPERQISPTWYKAWKDENLNRLVTLGLQNNTDIQSAVSKIKQARAVLWMNGVQYLPAVNVQGAYNYQKGSRNIRYAENAHYYTAGFDAAWEVDVWGKGRRQFQSDEATQKAMSYNLKNVQAVVTAEIVLQYVQLTATKERLRLAQENAAKQRQILQNVQDQYHSGLADELTYQQAQYLYENTNSKIPEFQRDIEQYFNALSVLTGIYPSDLPYDKDSASPLFRRQCRLTERDLEKLPVDVIRRRPDVAAAEQNLIGQNAQVGVAVAELYPSVNLSGLWGFASQGGRQLFGSDSHTYNYAPMIQMPLLDWNKFQNNVRLQKYIREEYAQQYKAAVLKALSEIRDAMVQVRQNIRANQSQYAAMQAGQKMTAAAQDKYDSGLTDFTEVLTNQQNYIQAQDNYVLGKAAIFQSIIAYYKAAGGGY